MTPGAIVCVDINHKSHGAASQKLEGDLSIRLVPGFGY
jgi:hypothetical protein